MTLTPPIKQGIKVKKWYGSNTVLKNLEELFWCQSQGFGERPEVYGPGGHNGLDFVYEFRTPVYACNAGTLTAGVEKDDNGNFKGYGKYVTIVGEGFKTTYAHLDETTTSRQIKRGELIGYGDSTGFSTGHHLHLTVKLVDNTGNVLNRDNGHDGAIDPTNLITWFDDMFELVQVAGSKEVWLKRDGRKTHIYNAGALLAISSFDKIAPITQEALDVLVDSGVDLLTAIKE